MRKIKLFFIPHAGGSAMAYMRLKKYLNKDYIEAVPLELAGRGKRIKEKCFTSIEECVADLFKKIKNETEECDYALFGHSLGALIAYELAEYIKGYGYKNPLCIFLSGRVAVNHNFSIDTIGNMDDDEFLRQFNKLQALPRGLIENKQILSLMLPILRADVKMSEDYCYKDKGLLECDIFGLYGDKDYLVCREGIEYWGSLTKKHSDTICFKGGHFYIDENRDLVGNKISNLLSKYHD